MHQNEINGIVSSKIISKKIFLLKFAEAYQQFYASIEEYLAEDMHYASLWFFMRRHINQNIWIILLENFRH